MRSPLKPLIVSAVLVLILVAALLWHPFQRSHVQLANEMGKTKAANDLGNDKSKIQNPKSKIENGLLFYCAAGIKPPVEETAAAYEKQYGVPIRLQYGGSGTLLSNLRVSHQGDLFLAADDSYIEIARKQGLMAETIPVAKVHPVLAVAKGNPKHIASVEDLLRPDVKAALANPDAASVGRLTQLLLEKTGAWTKIQEAVQARGVFKPTVNDVANDVKIGAVDAGIVWDATASQYPELQTVAIPNADQYAGGITVGVLSSTKQPTAALRFARYLTARDKGLTHFAPHGYAIAEDADEWAEAPELLYFAGAVNRLAIQDTLAAFEDREGVRIKTVFNGCGILVGSIKMGERPDVYQTCDASFMAGVEDLFSAPVNMSETGIVILTAKGNPHGIHGLADLAKPGLRVGLCNEKQSTLGALTARMLKADNILDAVSKNVVTYTPTADLLVNQIRTGSLDAVVVYTANTVNVRDSLDLVTLNSDAAKAVQTFAVGKNSRHKQLVGRLLDLLRSKESAQRYTKDGFRWLAQPPKT